MVNTVTGKSGRGTARQTVRIPDDEWDEFDAACIANGAERSAYLLNVVRWALGRPGAETPVPLPGALPAGVRAVIEDRTLREPKGHTAYALTVAAPADTVSALIDEPIRMMAAADDKISVRWEVAPTGDDLAQIRIGGYWPALTAVLVLLDTAGIGIVED